MSDIYVVIHIVTTCDDTTTYVTKDSTELIELSWVVLDAETLDNIHTDTILVRPVNTPITPYCSRLHNISWEHVRNAGSFKDAISKFDKYIQESIISQGKDFSLVTLDVSTLRVQLPREARDKGVVLPPYLQHPRVFDLRTEYSRWQSTHPESLSYTASSLSNIVTALEVEIENIEDFLSGPNSSSSTPPPTQQQQMNFDQQQQQQQPAQTISGDLETKSKGAAILYSKIATQLIRKSMPFEENPTVFTKPYDSAQDVRAFLTERSKILYLSNLPSDTTQSELESWFTQYGGRPVAFWTLKNLEDNNKNNNQANPNYRRGISGFAVFSTHEEATESLSMNGRALIDRIIEVQPSSTRVLDKANDLLTPFPSSKNRPRPGDWTCPSCGFSNFQRRTHCFRCSFPASSAVAIQESIYSNTPNSANGGSGGGSGGGVNIRRNNSQPGQHGGQQQQDKLNGHHPVNAAASVLNQTGYNNYHDNQGSHGQLQQQQQHQNYGNQGNYSGNQNNNAGGSGNTGNSNQNNNPHGNRSHYNNSVPFRAGDWKCELCVYHNFAKNLFCLKCGAAKPIMTSNTPHQTNAMHSVNSTAAAIAAATASGQPLNLNSGFMGLQQPQPHHAYGGSQANVGQGGPGQGQQQQQQRPGGMRTNSLGSSGYVNQQKFHYNQLRSSSNSGTPNQILSQQIPLYQQQQQQQGQAQGYSQSVGNSPGLYPKYTGGSYQPQQPQQKMPGSAPGSAGDATMGNFASLSNQMNTLSLNH